MCYIIPIITVEVRVAHMIQDFIRELSEAVGGLGALGEAVIEASNRRDRAPGPRVISADLAQQAAEEVIALAKFLSHFLSHFFISRDRDVAPALRWICYKVVYAASQAAGMSGSIKQGANVACSQNLAVIHDLLQLIADFDRANAPDFTSPRGPLNLLSDGGRSLLAGHPIHRALYSLDNGSATQLFAKLASKYEFESVVIVGPSAKTIKPPKYLEDAVMVTLYGSRISRHYSIQVIDMIKVLALYSHVIEYLSYCSDFPRAHAHALCRVNGHIELIEKECYDEKPSKECAPTEKQYHSRGDVACQIIVQRTAYQELCERALRYVNLRVYSRAYIGSDDPVLCMVNMELFGVVQKVRNISHQPGMGSHDERVAIMNKFFRSVEDFLMKYYLAQDIPDPTLEGAQAASSDEELDVSALEDAQASTISSVQGIQYP